MRQVPPWIVGDYTIERALKAVEMRILQKNIHCCPHHLQQNYIPEAALVVILDEPTTWYLKFLKHLQTTGFVRHMP
jgi:hypothetical protein